MVVPFPTAQVPRRIYSTVLAAPGTESSVMLRFTRMFAQEARSVKWTRQGTGALLEFPFYRLGTKTTEI